MALLFMDSFDHYVTADIAEKWSTAGGFTINASSGRRSSGGFVSSSSGCVKTLAPSGSVAIIGFALKVTALPGVSHNFFNFYASGSSVPQVTLGLTTSGTLTVKRGGTATSTDGTLLGTTTFAVTLNAYHYVELKTTLHDSAGTVDLRVDGGSKLSLTSQDTNNGASNLWTQIRFGDGSTLSYVIDDLYVLDGSGSAPWADFLGDCRVDARRPTAAGATTGWTPSTGSNWQNVDDSTPDDDSTYNTATAAPLTDTFTVEDAPVVGAAIYGVQHCISAKKTDAGTCTIAPVTRHSGTDYAGSDQSPTTSYAYYLQVNQTNPGTSAQWTEAGFNAAEFGYKRTA